MEYIALCFCLLYGPAPPEGFAEAVPAERVFALLERAAGLPVRRIEPDLDAVPVNLREEPGARAETLELVLKAHGIYVHHRVRRDGAEEIAATRSLAPPPREERRLAVTVYAPRHVLPEELAERVRAAGLPAGVEVIVEPRTGKLIFRGEKERGLAESLECARRLDEPRKGGRAFRLYRCDGVLVRDAHRELLRLMPRDVRRRVVIIPYQPVNTVLVACGDEDWESVLSLLRQINPEGEVLAPGPGELPGTEESPMGR